MSIGMTEQIDKVAEAIMNGHEECNTNGILFYDLLAERAIMAMRQPTDEMLAVVAELPPTHNRLDMWCAMIDVALGRIKLAEGDENEGRENSDGNDN